MKRKKSFILKMSRILTLHNNNNAKNLNEIKKLINILGLINDN